MQLKSFHVQLFRNIIDSKPIDVTSTTCLVGKNEAGKSALLEALHRLNPAKPQATFNLLDDYPRWLKKEHEITGQIEKAVPITATFELLKEEQTEIEARFGKGVLKSKTVTVTRKYTGGPIVDIQIELSKFFRHFISKQNASGLLKPHLVQIKNTKELSDILDTLSQEENEEGEPTPIAQAAKDARANLAELLGKRTNITGALQSVVFLLVPRTFYFSQYSQLRGRYELEEVVKSITDGTDDEEVQAAADFLTLARISPENLESWNYEESNAELEAISSLLTKRVKAHWKQNEHLKLSVKVEAVRAPLPDDEHNKDRYLQFRVEDTRHDFSNRLDRRSTGFRWFVSFMASFFEFEKDKNLILLLDEPGLSLHARAQMDLLGAIENKLSDGRQVIYTTHSPFMVRTELLQHVRIVEDQGPDIGSITINEAGSSSDPDTLFPLQAALGYDIAQNLFIGRHNVLLEGVSDFIYFSVISSHLGTLNRKQLPEYCRLLPAGGATNIPTFIALLGGKLEIVVVLDGDASRQRIDNAIVEGRLSANRVLSLDNFSPVKGADIEDLFSPDEYIALYNATYSTTLKVKDLRGKDRIIKRIERATKKSFDHGQVAGHFIKDQASILPSLSKETLDRFESVIAAIAKALPEKSADG